MKHDLTDGKAEAWAFRWLLSDQFPGHYIVTVFCAGFGANFPAVIDDFGNLIRVS